MADSSKRISFEELRPKILSSLKSKPLELKEPLTLIDGFLIGTFSTEISSVVTLGGPTIPMVMLLGDHTKQVYFFPLKSILPDIEI
jgi:hypothetical protein